MARDRPQKSEEDRIVNWGWALGLLLPIVGLMAAAVLFSRGDGRWGLILGWSLIGVVAYIFIFGLI